MTIQLSDHFTVGRLLRFTFPSIVMLIFTSIYGVVDGFFVSNFVGKTPFAAVNFIMPFLLVLGCVGFMFGTGGGALIAKTMGEGKREEANQIFSLLVYLSLTSGIVLAVLGLVLVSAFSLLLNLMADSGRKLYYAPMNRYLWLYAAIYLAGTWFSVTRAGSLLGGVLTVAFILFAVILENSITTRRQLDTLLLLLVMAGTAVALYGICQYLFGWGYQSAAWADSEMFGDVFRVPSTLENPNMLGQYLILAIPLGGAGLLAAKDWGMRVFYFCCCGVMCVCMLLTLSRGAWLGLLFAGFVFVLFLQPRLLLLTPLLLVGLYFVLPDAVINRFASIGNLGDSSTSYRVYIWMGTLAMLKDYWMCGIGPGDAAFNLVYPKYSYSGIVAPHAHNLFLQIVCDAGVVALVVFVLLLFHYFRDLCAAFCREKDPFSRLYQTAAVSGIAGFLVQAMTDYSFYNYRVLLLFWAWLALGALLARRGQLPERGLKV